jgi:phosphohistidine phosphatase
MRMKRLIFVRHGRAEDPNDLLPDFERSLTLKGKTISREMARNLLNEIVDPGILITSPAFRALETAIIFAGEFGIEAEKIKMEDLLYHHADLGSLLSILSGLDEDIVTLFGHNPSFSILPDRLCEETCDLMPKSGVLCISFKITKWSEIKPGTGKLEFFLKP